MVSISQPVYMGDLPVELTAKIFMNVLEEEKRETYKKMTFLDPRPLHIFSLVSKRWLEARQELTSILVYKNKIRLYDVPEIRSKNETERGERALAYIEKHKPPTLNLIKLESALQHEQQLRIFEIGKPLIISKDESLRLLSLEGLPIQMVEEKVNRGCILKNIGSLGHGWDETCAVVNDKLWKKHQLPALFS